MYPPFPRVILLDYLCVWLGCGHLDGLLRPAFLLPLPGLSSRLLPSPLEKGSTEGWGGPEFSRMNSRGGCVSECFPPTNWHIH